MEEGVKMSCFYNMFECKWPSTQYRLLYTEDVKYEPNSNHKSKTSNRYAKNKEQGIQVHH